MSKNIIFITAVKVPGQEHRSNTYDLGINSFKHWADKYNCEVFVLDQLLFPNDQMKINFHRYYCFDLLDESNIDYDQVLITDADAIIHPDCPNFFELTDNKYTVTRCDGSFDWICRSKENYEHFFNNGNSTYNLWDYFNAGFQVVNKQHKDIFKKFTQFYWDNVDLVKHIQQNFGVGTDQALLNYFIRTQDVELKYLPYRYCMADLFLKNLLADDLFFINIPGIYQFNAIPNNKDANLTHKFMDSTYKHLYNGKK